MNYIKQVYAEMRQQPLPTWLSISGTALSIFLVMTMFMLNDLPNVEAKPEVNRKSMLVGEGVHMKDTDSRSVASTMGLSVQMADRMYRGLEGIEKISYSRHDCSETEVGLPGAMPETANSRYVDDVYWQLFDFDFIAGRPFTKAEVQAGVNVAVISEKLARQFFKSSDVVGKEIYFKNHPYRIAGVIKDVSPIFTLAYADIYTPINLQPQPWDRWLGEYTGDISVFLLKKKGVSDESIKAQVKARYDALNKQLMKDRREAIYHNTPYNMQELVTQHGSNTTPEPNYKLRWTIYGILLLIPAINLSGMSRSRLTNRISEIGVRRAFGATRSSVVNQLLIENFIVTLLGGLIGLILCVIFIIFFSHLFLDISDYVSNFGAANLSDEHPPFRLLFTWPAFAFAILFCALLNVLSTGFPVLKATSINPAEAISGSDDIKK